MMNEGVWYRLEVRMEIKEAPVLQEYVKDKLLEVFYTAKMVIETIIATKIMLY